MLGLLGSCSLVVEPDVDSIGSPPRACMPGEQDECACLGGLSGTQRCNDGGSFDPCTCGAAGSGG
jgi:hypothetical protein